MARPRIDRQMAVCWTPLQCSILVRISGAEAAGWSVESCVDCLLAPTQALARTWKCIPCLLPSIVLAHRAVCKDHRSFEWPLTCSFRTWRRERLRQWLQHRTSPSACGVQLPPVANSRQTLWCAVWTLLAGCGVGHSGSRGGRAVCSHLPQVLPPPCAHASVHCVCPFPQPASTLDKAHQRV